MKTLKITTILLVLLTGCQSTPKIIPYENKQVIIYQNWPDTVYETSGLAKEDSIFFTVNDSGNAAELHRFDELTKQWLEPLTVSDSENIDWEDIAQDEDNLYIADCGNNAGKRFKFTIYKVNKNTAINQSRAKQSVDSTKIIVKLKDQPNPLVLIPHKHNYDCEALTVVENQLWLFTKNWGDAKTNHYRIQKSKQIQTIEASATYNTYGLITAADYNEKIQKIALLGYNKRDSFVWIAPVLNHNNIIWAEAKYYRIFPRAQWEAVIWDTHRNNRLYLSREDNGEYRTALGYIEFDKNINN